MKYENYRSNTLLKPNGYKLSRNVVNCVLKFGYEGMKFAVNKVDYYDEFQTKGSAVFSLPPYFCFYNIACIFILEKRNGYNLEINSVLRIF